MTSPLTNDDNAAQIAYWNGPGGDRWVSHQRMQDALLAEVAERLIERAAPHDGETVLDIGCGAGTTSIVLAQRVAPDGRVLGVDVSAPLLERARQHAPAGLPLEFALGDATVYPFAPGAADLLFSRFGIMFFADPAKSFANMRGGLRAGARVVFACWRAPRENPWLMLPLQAAYRHVPRLPEAGPEDPGLFSFASEPRVRSILERAGFGAIAGEPVRRFSAGRAASRSGRIGPRGARAIPAGEPPAAAWRDLDCHRAQPLSRSRTQTPRRRPAGVRVFSCSPLWRCRRRRAVRLPDPR